MTKLKELLIKLNKILKIMFVFYKTTVLCKHFYFSKFLPRLYPQNGSKDFDETGLYPSNYKAPLIFIHRVYSRE